MSSRTCDQWDVNQIIQLTISFLSSKSKCLFARPPHLHFDLHGVVSYWFPFSWSSRLSTGLSRMIQKMFSNRHACKVQKRQNIQFVTYIISCCLQTDIIRYRKWQGPEEFWHFREGTVRTEIFILKNLQIIRWETCKTIASLAQVASNAMWAKGFYNIKLKLLTTKKRKNA